MSASVADGDDREETTNTEGRKYLGIEIANIQIRIKKAVLYK